MAAAIYAGAVALDLSVDTLEIVQAFHIFAQMLVGAGMLVWAIRRSFRRSGHELAAGT